MCDTKNFKIITYAMVIEKRNNRFIWGSNVNQVNQKSVPINTLPGRQFALAGPDLFFFNKWLGKVFVKLPEYRGESAHVCIIIN
jgi:hypothetical protein